MKRSDLTGSVVSVSADDIKKTVATSLDQALQGKAAGVQVTQNSGAPGGGISVSIRGTNSLNGNEAKIQNIETFRNLLDTIVAFITEPGLSGFASLCGDHNHSVARAPK